MEFRLNQIVKGQVAGTFIILGFREINGEQHAQLKEIDPDTQKTYSGELALPLSAIRPIS